MKKIFYTLLIALALGSWSMAQAQQAQGANTDKSSHASGIVSGPTVDARDHSATIRWQTQDKAGSIIKYGTDKNNLSKSKEAGPAGGSRDHNVTLSDLQPGTKYFYQIQKGNGEVRTAGEFTTKGAGESASAGSQGGKGEDHVVITEGPTVQPGPDGTAKIVWKTDDIAANDVKYGTDPNNLQQRAYKPGGSREHEADLKNLQAGQTYHYAILRRDGSVRTTNQFQYQPQAAAAAPGPAGSPQQPSAVQISAGPWLDTVADNNAIITWKTNVPSNSVVKYGTDRNTLTQTATGAWGTDHAVHIQGLNPNAIYFFKTHSTQARGQTPAESVVGAFQTVAPGAQAKKNPPILP